MTVSVQTPFNSSTGNGVTTVFPYTFKVISANDLKVTVNGVLKTNGTDYTVSGIGSDGGGNVTFTVAPASGAVVVRYSDTVIKRDTDYQANGDFKEAVVDDDFDRIWLGLRDVSGKVDRSFRVPPGETILDLPAASTRANRILGFDAAGAPVAAAGSTDVTVSVYASTILDDATAADARSTLGARKLANVKTDHGATGNGSTDDTAAIQAAIDAVKSTGGIVYIPPGTYMISRLNLAGISNRGFMFVGDGWDNTKFMPISGTASYGTATGHLFDCTGSVGLTFRDFQVGAFNQTPEPTTCFFFAQVASGVSNAHHLDGLYLTGKYTTATVYNYGVPSSDAINCDFYNYKAGAGAQSVARWDSTNTASLTSSFATVTSGDLPTSDWTFVGSEFHKFAGVGANNQVVRLDGANDIRFIGGNITGGAAAYVGLLSSPERIAFIGTTFETESEPVMPTNVFDIPSGTVEGLSWDQCEYIVGSAIVGGAGGLLGGTGNLEFMLHSTPSSGIGSGATIYLGPAGHSAAEGQAETITTHRGLLNHLRAQSSAAPGAGQSYTVTIRVNGVDTGITATISDSGSAAADLTHYAHLVPGDRVSAKAVSSAGADSTARIKVALGMLTARR